MSDTSLVFALSTRDDTGPGMRDARETVETETAGMADAAAANGSKMGTAMAAAGAAAGALAGAALMSTFSQAMDVSSATAKLEAQLANTSADVGAASDAMKNVFTAGWGESATEVGDAIKSVTLNMDAFTGNQQGLEDMTTKTLGLSKAFNQDLNVATAAAGQMVKTGMAKDFDEAMDLLAAGLGSVANKSDDLLDTMNEYSTQFRRVGLDGATAMGLISQGLEAGARDADAVADALGIFGEMALAGGDQVNKAFGSIGLNGVDIGRKMRAGGDQATQALQETMDALRGTDDATTRLAAAQVLFGDLANTQADALWALDPASAAAAGGFDDVAGAADKVVDKMESSPAMKMEAFKRTLQQNVIDFLGGTVLPAVTDFKTKFQTEFASIWTEAGKGGTDGIDRVLDFVVILGQRLGQKLVTDLVPRAIEGMQTAGQRVADWAMANPTEVLKTAAIAGAILMALVALPALVAVGISALGISMMYGFVSSMIEALVANVPRWWQAFTGWVSQKAGEAGAVLSSLGSAIGAWFSRLWSTYIAGPVSGAWRSFIGSVAALPARASSALGGLAGAVRERASTAFHSMKDAAVQRAQSLIDWARGLPARITSALGNLGRLLWNSGSALINGFINGIMSRIGSVRDAASSVVSAARDFFPFSPAKEGPFSGTGYTTYSGEALVQDFQGGISSQIPALQSLLDGLPGVAPQSVQAAPLGVGMAPALAAGGLTRVIVDVRGGDEDMKRMVRKWVRVDGGGSTQSAFGR
ncbi:phage tail tape measure protein [Streptomyces phaeoluteigriseus]|uniref:Phage tail tape measure protein n=1 Tax=Streptomyces phaeoluteigriseus TaxID=114686 RepID=A0ABY4Z0P7_9ACTN|nr:phage tail tape measure protein [Streptomyces phaeoluteigriseus]USQ82627.1 phage tail tape measure protein [Streptomyces phaeoluteigriseus]